MKVTVSAALRISGIHPLFIVVINKSLQEKVAAQNLENSMHAISAKLKKLPYIISDPTFKRDAEGRAKARPLNLP